ncbi:MAG: tRNA 2-thiouridine(34) synthase MnmA [Nitrospirae bacterium]|nr:tRNA 2-thiouridine(34) synthase MnmA [Nitrospirota bacterium]
MNNNCTDTDALLLGDRPKVLVGMSGGVDSSITAYLLRQQGYYTEGLSFILWGSERSEATGSSSACCSAASLNDAKATALALGIKHSLLDVRLEFMQQVIEPFIESYKRGFTPNPCVLCNQYVKFPYLLSEADARGFDYIATGHYAVIERQPEPSLLTASDRIKDQSYFLYVLNRQTLSRLLFPLGWLNKTQVKELARDLTLPCCMRPESQDICFVDNTGYRGFLTTYLKDAQAAGPIVDMGGKTIGTHNGLYAYTIGQRRGIGIAAKEPLYVIDVDISSNTLIVGPKSFGLKGGFKVNKLNWLVPVTNVPELVHVKFRSTMRPTPASIKITSDNTIEVIMHTLQWSPAPGQSAVLYVGDKVIGGGEVVEERRRGSVSPPQTPSQGDSSP